VVLLMERGLHGLDDVAWMMGPWKWGGDGTFRVKGGYSRGGDRRSQGMRACAPCPAPLYRYLRRALYQKASVWVFAPGIESDDYRRASLAFDPCPRDRFLSRNTVYTAHMPSASDRRPPPPRHHHPHHLNPHLPLPPPHPHPHTLCHHSTFLWPCCSLVCQCPNPLRLYAFVGPFSRDCSLPD